jgi:hypothetical protein
MRLPRHPFIYEINAWVWLSELSTNGKPLRFDEVEQSVWDKLTELGMDAVWFMGVWERSPRGREIALADAGLRTDFSHILPGFEETDVVGSPYCVRDYRVDPRLGGDEALAQARAKLAERGVGLILDFVPNHTAVDHAWTTDHPDVYIRGTDADLARDPSGFYHAGEMVIAHGRDPNYPAWTDVAQLNAFSPELRALASEVMARLATMCDGVRCDMAMLLLNDVFERTWGQRAGARPPEEYWQEVLPRAKAANPDFLCIAESYWNMEYTLQTLGFDFCYDKRLYERLQDVAIHGPEGKVREHLAGDPGYEEKLLRFVENHDEPRAVTVFPDKALLRAAVVLTLAAPGARLVHDGQLEGRKVKLPVQLGRRPSEAVDDDLLGFMKRLLAEHHCPAFRNGTWRLCPTSGWPDNQSHHNLVAFAWQQGQERRLAVVNLSPSGSQGFVHTGWDDVAGHCRLKDGVQDQSFECDASDLASSLYVGLAGFGFHFLRVEITG